MSQGSNWEVKFRVWKFNSDPNSTSLAYLEIKHGAADSCKCGSCKNFVAVRDCAYPREVMNLFQQLGIDYRKEDEIMRFCRDRQGLHWYQGGFYFVGSIALGRTEAYRWPWNVAVTKTLASRRQGAKRTDNRGACFFICPVRGISSPKFGKVNTMMVSRWADWEDCPSCATMPSNPSFD